MRCGYYSCNLLQKPPTLLKLITPLVRARSTPTLSPYHWISVLLVLLDITVYPVSPLSNCYTIPVFLNDDFLVKLDLLPWLSFGFVTYVLNKRSDFDKFWRKWEEFFTFMIDVVDKIWTGGTSSFFDCFLFRSKMFFWGEKFKKKIYVKTQKIYLFF